MPDQPRRYASPATAAHYAEVSRATIHNWIKRGQLTAYRMNARVIRVDLNELDALLTASVVCQ